MSKSQPHIFLSDETLYQWYQTRLREIVLMSFDRQRAVSFIGNWAGTGWHHRAAATVTAVTRSHDLINDWPKYNLIILLIVLYNCHHNITRFENVPTRSTLFVTRCGSVCNITTPKRNWSKLSYCVSNYSKWKTRCILSFRLNAKFVTTKRQSWVTV